jgi:amino acid adenylation domain-containing protein
MTIVELLGELRRANVQLSLEGDKLKIKAPQGALTDAMKDALKARKDEVMSFLRSAQEVSAAPFPRIDRGAALPLSFMQQGLWFVEQLAPGTPAYTMPIAFRVQGALDLDVLQYAMDQVVARHETLRCRFPATGEGVPCAVIDDRLSFVLRRRSRECAAVDVEAVIREEVRAAALAVFDLERGPLFWLSAVTLVVEGQAAPVHLVVGAIHHIISDGWSHGLLIREILTFYVSRATGLPLPVPELSVQYVDFAAWQQSFVSSDIYRRKLERWLDHLKGIPSHLALPTDFPRPPVQTSHGAKHRFTLDERLSGRIREFCLRCDVTPFMALMTGWQILLSRYGRQADFCVGIPTAGRRHQSLETLIGFFVDPLIVRSSIQPELTLSEVLARVKAEVLGAFERQDVPMAHIIDRLDVPRNPAWSPVAQVGFQLQNFSGVMSGSDADREMFAKIRELIQLDVDVIEIDDVASKFDMILSLVQHESHFSGEVEYNADLFRPSTIGRMMTHLSRILDQIIDHPGLSVRDVSLSTQQELVDLLQIPADMALRPLTDTQRLLYLDSLVHPDTLQNSVGFSVDFDFPIDGARLRRAVEHVTRLYSVHATRFVSCDLPWADPVWQVAGGQPEIDYAEVDCQGMSTSELCERSDQFAHCAYDVTSGPLYGFRYFINGTRTRLTGRFHHLIYDGVTSVAWYEKLRATYQALESGQPLPVWKDAFPDYITARRAVVDAPATLAFWTQAIGHVSPLSFSRIPDVPPHRPYEVRSWRFGTSHSAAIDAWCRQRGVRAADLFRLLMRKLVQAYCRPEGAFLVNEMNNGRLTGTEDTLGCFYQVFPCVVEPAELARDLDIVEAIHCISGWRDRARDHRNVSILHLLDQVEPSPVNFQFNYMKFGLLSAWSGHQPHFEIISPYVERTCQLILKEANDGHVLETWTDRTVFDDHHFLERIDDLSRQVIEGRAECLGDLDLRLPDERAPARIEEAVASLAVGSDIVAAIACSVARYPETTAVQCGDVTISYAALWAQSASMAASLAASGVGRGERVAICLGRRVEWLVAVLAVLRTGASYIPIESSYPCERIRFIIDDSAARTVITEACLLDRIGDSPAAEVMVIDGTPQTVATDWTDLSIDPASEIYVIYTSGSTGTPKGASVTHQGETNLQAWYTRLLGMQPGDASLIISAFGFDLTQKNLFAPLMSGARVVIPSFEEYDDALIVAEVERHGVTVINCAPSAFYPLVADPQRHGRLASLRHVVLGGEPIRLTLLSHWLSGADCRARVVNSYGPTECTDVVAFHVIEDLRRPEASVPLGRAVPHCGLHVLDDDLRPAIPGLIGELCISGICVGNGYLNRPEQTAAAFVTSPLTGQRLYRTGDLVRELGDGTLEYIGRKDFQVKVRGLRIELGEIEQAITACPGVSDALVLCRDESLVGYAVSSDALDVSAMFSLLRDRLPVYMVPSAIVVLPAWPLTPNGKVDRKALPSPAGDASGVPFVAPRTEVEQQLAQIWQDVLRRERIGVDDNFFALGGHSLLATQIVSRIRQSFGTQMGLRDFLAEPTIGHLAKRLASMETGAAGLQGPVRVSRDQRLPLSFGQQRLWFLDRLEPGSTAYHVPVALQIRGTLDVALLSQAISIAINRHESLRTVFGEDAEGPFQVILPVQAWLTEVRSVRAVAGDVDFSVAREVASVLAMPFDLATGPLFRSSVVKVTDHHHVFVFVAHHAVTDGWSMGLFIRDVIMAFHALVRQAPVLLMPASLHYADYAVWQRTINDPVTHARKLDWWTSCLSDVPALEFPSDRRRPPVQTYKGSDLAFQWSPELSAAIDTYAAGQGSTPFNVLLALLAATLNRYTGQQDFAIGTPVAGRQHPDLESVSGFFVNTVALRVRPDGTQSLNDAMSTLTQTSLQALDYQDVPFEEIVDAVNPVRDRSRSPLFQVMLVLQNLPLGTHAFSDVLASFEDLSVEAFGVTEQTAKFDLTLTVSTFGGVYTGALQYNTDLYDAQTVTRVLDTLERLARAWVATPDQPLQAMDLLTPDQRRAMIMQWHASQRALPADQSVQEWMASRFAQHADRVAVVCGDRTLTYRELDQASSAVAQALRQRGVNAGDAVGVCFDRSLHLMSALLGVIRSGACYVPIDASYPPGRIAHMLANSQIDCVLTRAGLTASIPSQAVTLDVDAIVLESAEAGWTRGSGDDLFYVIYTSGSTGVPKGAAVYHRSVINLLQWYTTRFSMSPDDRVLLMSAIGFDLTQKNLWAPLMVGAALVIPDFEEYDPVKLGGLVRARQVTWINAAPSAFYPLVEENPADHLLSLRWVFLGGEPINLSRLSQWYSRTSTRLVNSYGPTECTDISSYHVVAHDHPVDVRIPIGLPNDNVSLFVLGARQEVLPPGAVGELCVGGMGVGAGYIGSPDLTAKVFLDNPYADGRLYRTGDLVRQLPDGAIDYLGRMDQQVKLRGYRIELSEIQSVLLAVDGVVDAFVGLTHEQQSSLVAWIIGASGETSTLEASLRGRAQQFLPVFMQPVAYVFLDAFPLTPNGKIDRKALPGPTMGDGDSHLPPQTELERLIAAVWSSVLQVERIGLQSDFFLLGGNSLQATSIVSRLNRQLDIRLSVRSVFDHPQMSAFVDCVSSAQQSAGRPDIVPAPLEAEMLPAFGQSRLWFFEQLNPGTCVNIMPAAVMLDGVLDQDALAFALDELCRRHSLLSTRFWASADGSPRMSVSDEARPSLERLQIAGVSLHDRRQRVQERLQQVARTPFDLTRGGLLRLCQIRFLSHPSEAESDALVFSMHHIISDGLSLQVLFAELMTHYAAYVSRVPVVLPPLRLQYADFARWQRHWIESGGVQSQLAFWKHYLSDVPDTNTFPSDASRPEVQTTRGATYALVMPRDVSDGIQERAREWKTTPFVLCLTAWKALMARYLRRPDISIGVPTSGRSHPDLEPLIGFFINSVIIRTQWEQNDTLGAIVEAVKASALGAFAHGDVPLDLLMQSLTFRRSVSHTPIVQTAFQWTEHDVPAVTTGGAFAGMAAEWMAAERGSANFDITVSLSRSQDQVRAEFEYNTDLFGVATIQRLAAQFLRVLTTLLRDPGCPLQALSLVSHDELPVRLGLAAEHTESVRRLTHMQRDMFMDNLINPMSLQSSHGFAHHLRHAVDVGRLQQAIDGYVRDFGLARSRFLAVGEPDLEEGYLVIQRDRRILLEVVDNNGRFVSREALHHWIDAFVYRTYDLAADALLRFQYIRVSDDHHVIAASAHHALLDGMGLEHLWRDLIRRYESLSAGRDPESVQDRFADHIEEDRRSKDTADVRRFWRERLSRVEPLDFTVPPPIPEAARAISRQRVLDDRHVDAIRAFCKRQRITPAIYFKVVYALAIQVFCRPAEDFTLQETLSGRPASHADQAGCYIQEVPFVFPRAMFTGDATIDGLFVHAREFQKQSRDHRLISLGLMNELTPRGRTVFMYNYYQFVPASYHFNGEVLESPEALSSDPANNVQFIVKAVGGRQTLNLYYHPHLFADLGFLDLVESVSRQLVLQDVRHVRELHWVEEGSSALQALQDWNHTTRHFDLSLPVHEVFVRQASRTPGAVAIIDHAAALTYRELDERSNRLARHLQTLGVRPGDLVGVCIARSCRFLEAVLSILKTGAAYVPMDANYPAERLSYMRDNSAARVIVTELAQCHKLEGGRDVLLLALDACEETLGGCSAERLAPLATPESVAYMLYTSGSTGLPKGALIRHDGALNHIEAERDVLGFDGAFHFLQTAPTSSDISVWQFLGPVCCGGAVVVLDDVTDAARMFGLIRQHHVNIVELVPVAWQLLIDHVDALEPDARALPSLRWLMATGEAVPVPMVNQWLALYPDIPVVNAYGPTEAADDVVQNIIRSPLPVTVRSVPIGRPLGNMNAFVVDEDLRLVPPGVPGEIVLSGIGVGNGYWQNPEKSALAFVPNPFPWGLGSTLYRTGDLGRWLADGTLEYLDRVDNQVKIRGFRIELGEVESVLAAQTGVGEAVVTVVRSLPGGPALVGYVIPSGGDRLDVAAVKAGMRARLPEYMVPSFVVTLDAFPTTPAGKVDRKALPVPAGEDDAHYEAPANERESQLADLFGQVLGLPRVSVDREFFDLGGNSLMAVRLVARLQQTLGVSLNVAVLLRHPSPRALAWYLSRGDTASGTLCVSLDGRSDAAVDDAHPAVVFVHPVGGDVLTYRELAGLLSGRGRLLGLRHPLLAGQTAPDTLAVLIQQYAGALAEAGVRSLHLVGQSLGGVLAQALVPALGERGIRVQSVAMIDSFLPSAMQITPAELLPRALGLHLPEGLLGTLDFAGDGWIDQVYGLALGAGLVPVDLDLDRIRTIYRAARSSEALAQTWVATSPDIPVLHVRAQDNPLPSDQGWQSLGGQWRSEALPGDHESILKAPAVHALAALLQEFQSATTS